ncbi:MAG: DMT family transporter [Pseudomonadales bacterium]
MRLERKDHMDALGASLLIGFSVLLGLNQALVKLVNTGFAPVFQSGLRSFCAFFVVLAWAALTRKRINFRDGTLGWGLLLGVLFALEFAMLFIALEYTTVSRVSLFFYSMPLFTAVGAHFLFPEERLHTGKVTGLAVALGGLALGLSDDTSRATDTAWVGDALAIGGAICWAGIALAIRASPLVRVSSEQVMLYQLGVSALLLLPAAPLFGEMVRNVTPGLIGIFAFQVVAIASLGFLMWARILTLYPVGNMASFSLLTPLFGVFFGWLVFDDPLTLRFAIALLLVGGGLLLINRRRV